MSETSPRVLLIDDSEGYVRLAHKFLRRYEYATNCDLTNPCWECDYRRGCNLKQAHDWTEAAEIMRRYGGEVDAILLDVHFDLPEEQLLAEPGLPGAEGGGPEELEKLRRFQGFHILRRLRRRYGQIPVVLMTSNTSIAFNEEEIKNDLENEEYTQLFEDEEISAQSLAAKIERALRMGQSQTAAEEGPFFWGTSRSMARIRRWLEVFAQGDQPILLLGETGTGKSFIAEQFIHPQARPEKVFCSIDLATIPENLVAAELFGTAKGAFSGAVGRPGRFEYASGGTLFLDEIGNLSQELQKRLLGVLQDRRVTRLGENNPRPVDVKLVVATNEDLAERVREGSFRADLYQRLNPAAKVVLPPLRDRKEDLRGMCAFLVRRVFVSPGNQKLLSDFGVLFGLNARTVSAVLTFSQKLRPTPPGTVTFQIAGLALDCLEEHDFPGNTRQLEMVLTNALLFSLTDALAAGRVGDRPVVAIDAQVLRELIAASDVGEEREVLAALDAQRMIVNVGASDTLNNASRDVERQYFEELYLRCGGDFERMAGHLLDGSAAKNARKVQLRFNNLGLSVRDLRDRFS
jgi:two-component system nitrogen regulation response regulator GlnG